MTTIANAYAGNLNGNIEIIVQSVTQQVLNGLIVQRPKCIYRHEAKPNRAQRRKMAHDNKRYRHENREQGSRIMYPNFRPQVFEAVA